MDSCVCAALAVRDHQAAAVHVSYGQRTEQRERRSFESICDRLGLAGKDVYVEKPCPHNMFEARQIVAAAQKYGRMVQHGSQQRSGIGRAVVQHIREGLIGDVYMARGLCFKRRDTIGRKPVEPVPPGIHYDLWLGPAPQHEYTANRLHYNWHWFWDYGNGDLGNQGIHQVDMARWGLGVKYPTKVSAIGGHFMFDDDQETPNTLTATFEFDEVHSKKIMVFEVRHWISNHEAGIGEPDHRQHGRDHVLRLQGLPLDVGRRPPPVLHLARPASRSRGLGLRPPSRWAITGLTSLTRCAAASRRT